MPSGFANEALAEYRVLFEDDWEKQWAANYWCLYWEALACHELGRAAEATVLYGACLGKDPGFMWPYLNLCLLYAENEDLELARGFIEQAIEIDPDSRVAQETRAAICLTQQDFAAARKSIRAAEALGYDSEKLRAYREMIDVHECPKAKGDSPGDVSMTA